MSITAIACQAQGIRAGEVIAKLAEDAYFMRVDNRVNQPPPARNRDNEATSRSANLGRNCTRAEPPTLPNRTRANAGGPSQGGNSNREVVPRRRRQRRRKLQPQSQQEGCRRRQSRRSRPHEQPRLRSLTRRLRRPPED
jgi:hypothetical protein